MNLAKNFVVALSMTIVMTLTFGVAYPIAVTGVAQWLFPDRANGQLVRDDEGHVIGSALIGQAFSAPDYFHPRPSAAGARGYDASASGGTNLGPTNRKLVEAVAARVAAAEIENPGVPVPIDLVTSSGSGLDPHLSPAAALFQVPRVAKARGASTDSIRALVDANIVPRQFGILGEPTVNVLRLNLALDERFPRK